MQDDFRKLYAQYITRDGADKFIDWLDKSDFFTAPASTRFHNNFEGGLVEHSVNVYNCLKQLTKDLNYSDETIALVALLHDICKANTYKVDFRNAKNEYGQWVKVPYYVIDEKFPFGHGEKSVFLINQFMNLSMEEAMAIRWHMGGFDNSVKGGDFSQSKAYEKYPLAVLLHTADLMATFIYEKAV
ncbi:MAG: HD domain-containing protein [Oscillospiraceae bacterium]